MDSVKEMLVAYSLLSNNCGKITRDSFKERMPPLKKPWLFYSRSSLRNNLGFLFRIIFNPDPFKDSFPATEFALTELEKLTDDEIKTYIALNKIEKIELNRYYLFNSFNKILITITTILGIFASLKKAFDVDLLAEIGSLFNFSHEGFRTASSDFFLQEIVWIGMSFMLSIIISLFVIGPKLNRSRMLGNLIYLVMESRGINIGSKNEPK